MKIPSFLVNTIKMVVFSMAMLVSGSVILLMLQNSGDHHLGCFPKKNLSTMGFFYQPQLVSRISEPSTVPLGCQSSPRITSSSPPGYTRMTWETVFFESVNRGIFFGSLWIDEWVGHAGFCKGEIIKQYTQTDDSTKLPKKKQEYKQVPSLKVGWTVKK